MPLTVTRIGAAILSIALLPATAWSTPATYRYAITSHQFGTIGTYVRSANTVDALERAQSKIRITVRMLGIPVYSEQADENEAWRGGQLVSFESRSTINGKTKLVHGELHAGRLEITTPKGTKIAPVGAVAADPWSIRHVGPATVVTVKTGEIVKIVITGGESEKVIVDGVPTLTRHYHVATATQPNWWEIWLDPHDVPVKFRNLEHGRTVDFALMAAPPVIGSGANPFSR
jgi:hypothetical protein